MWKRFALMLVLMAVLSAAVLAAGEAVTDSVAPDQPLAAMNAAPVSDKAQPAAVSAGTQGQEVSPQEAYFTVTYVDNAGTLATEVVPEGKCPTQAPETTSDGRSIWGWFCDGTLTDLDAAVTADLVYTAWAAPLLNTDEHVAFAIGRTAGSFAPNASLTRAEAAVMLFRLLETQEPGPLECSYTDLEVDAWYYAAVETLTSLGVLTGYDGGTFQPEAAMLRGEFVALLTRFFSLETGENPFPDVDEDHWAYDEILSAAAMGWLSGYDDGTFHPDDAITRAEAVAAINAVLGRSASDEETLALLTQEGLHPFTDVSPTDPFYADVLEATTVHAYTTGEDGEVWTAFEYTDCGYEPGIYEIDGYWYHVNEHEQFDVYPSGVHLIDGKLYYADENGRLPVLQAGVQELDDGLYCVQADGSLRTNYQDGYLYFGADGKYTSGNTELDAMVEELLAQCVTKDMTADEKFYAAYLYIRDNYTYLSGSHAARGSTDWAEDSAVRMFTRKKGNCYCYAAALMYTARRLGYQAYVVSGGVGSTNLDHGWTMIGDLLYDVEMEYAYMYRYSVRRNYDLFGIDPAAAPFQYYFPS